MKLVGCTMQSAFRFFLYLQKRKSNGQRASKSSCKQMKAKVFITGILCICLPSTSNLKGIECEIKRGNGQFQMEFKQGKIIQLLHYKPLPKLFGANNEDRGTNKSLQMIRAKGLKWRKEKKKSKSRKDLYKCSSHTHTQNHTNTIIHTI